MVYDLMVDIKLFVAIGGTFLIWSAYFLIQNFYVISKLFR